MTGYDQKSLKLSHDASVPVTFTVAVDLTAKGDWKTFKQFTVQPGQTLQYQFPDGYTAHWIKATTDKDCKATMILDYK